MFEHTCFNVPINFISGFPKLLCWCFDSTCPGWGGREPHLARDRGELSVVSVLVGNSVLLNDPRVSFLSFSNSAQIWPCLWGQAGFGPWLLRERPLVARRDTSLLLQGGPLCSSSPLPSFHWRWTWGDGTWFCQGHLVVPCVAGLWEQRAWIKILALPLFTSGIGNITSLNLSFFIDGSLITLTW